MRKVTYLCFLLMMNSCGGQKVEETEIEPKAVVQEVKEIPETLMTAEFVKGSWMNIDQKDIDFLLHLNVHNGVVAGEYCSRAKDRFFEDCAAEDEGGYCSVRGELEQSIITITTESCVTYELGEAILQRSDSLLVWELKKAPGAYGEKHLMPETVKLKKYSEEPIYSN